MPSIYELTTAYRDLMDALDGCETDEEAQDIINAVGQIENDIMAKGDAYTRIVRNLTSDVEALDAEIKRLEAKKKRTSAAIERLKDNLKQAMSAANIDKIKTPIGTWSKRLGPWSVQIEDEDAVPDRFKVPQPPKISKTAILDEFKQTGECLPGCEFQKREIVMLR